MSSRIGRNTRSGWAELATAAGTQELTVTPASLWHVPMIFDLMLEGSERGSFSDCYLDGRGYAKLLWKIGRGVMSSWLGSHDAWRVVEIGGEPAGFYVLTAPAALQCDTPLPDGCGIDAAKLSARILALCATAPAPRALGYG